MSTSRNLSGLGRLALRPAGRSVRVHTQTTRLWSSIWESPRRTKLHRTSLLPRQALQCFSTTPIHLHGHVKKPKPGEELYVTFIDKEGQEVKISCCEGESLLDIAQANDIEMEGACGGSIACSTCHVIVDPEWYDKTLPSEGEPCDEELDMLDLAFGLTDTSRLGCQIFMKKELDGLKVKLPAMTRNIQASNFAEQSASSSPVAADVSVESQPPPPPPQA